MVLIFDSELNGDQISIRVAEERKRRFKKRDEFSLKKKQKGDYISLLHIGD